MGLHSHYSLMGLTQEQIKKFNKNLQKERKEQKETTDSVPPPPQNPPVDKSKTSKFDKYGGA